MLTEQRHEQAGNKFWIKAIGRHGDVPEKMAIDGSAINDMDDAVWP